MKSCKWTNFQSDNIISKIKIERVIHWYRIFNYKTQCPPVLIVTYKNREKIQKSNDNRNLEVQKKFRQIFTPFLYVNIVSRSRMRRHPVVSTLSRLRRCWDQSKNNSRLKQPRTQFHTRGIPRWSGSFAKGEEASTREREKETEGKR